MVLALAFVLAGYVALVGPLYVWFLPATATMGAALLGVLLVALVVFGARIALWTATAVRLDPEEYPDLYAPLGRLARQADVATPTLAVVSSDEPNAFTAGSGEKTVVCVTTGLLETLDDAERDAVLAHELAHVKNRDSLVMTVAAFPLTVALLLFLLSSAMADGDGNGILVGIGLLIAAIVLLFASLPPVLVLSRYREFAADRGAVAITGEPAALAGALRTIHDVERTPETDLRARGIGGVNAFCFVPSGNRHVPLPSLHPPTRERIERVRELAREMETA